MLFCCWNYLCQFELVHELLNWFIQFHLGCSSVTTGVWKLPNKWNGWELLVRRLLDTYNVTWLKKCFYTLKVLLQWDTENCRGCRFLHLFLLHQTAYLKIGKHSHHQFWHKMTFLLTSRIFPYIILTILLDSIISCFAAYILPLLFWFLAAIPISFSLIMKVYTQNKRSHRWNESTKVQTIGGF